MHRLSMTMCAHVKRVPDLIRRLCNSTVEKLLVFGCIFGHGYVIGGLMMLRKWKVEMEWKVGVGRVDENLGRFQKYRLLRATL